MSRVSYFMDRVGKIDKKAMWKTTGVLKKRSGKSRAWLMQDMLKCGVKYNAGYMDYKIAQMYRLNDDQRKTVITRGISNDIVRRMNPKEFWHFFDDKAEFNKTFREWIPRKWIRIDDQTDPEELFALCRNQEALIGKPLEGSSGQGIQKYTREDWKEGPEAFLARLRQDGIGILEEIVVQHPKMASLCPTSVNTCRIATLLGDKQQGIVYAFLRIGNGKVMDNVDCGHGGPDRSGKRQAPDRRGGQAGEHLHQAPDYQHQHHRLPDTLLGGSEGHVYGGGDEDSGDALHCLGCGDHGKGAHLHRGEQLSLPCGASVCGALSRWDRHPARI